MKIVDEKFDFIKINLASPENLRKLAERILPDGKIIGEVKKTDTVNYKTFKPEMNGLFCEQIFGPIKTGECSCGLYKYARKLGFICEICGVDITDSRVRRHRMGYIKLLSSVIHIWYLKGRPSYISLILKKKVKHLEKIIYFDGYFNDDFEKKKVDKLKLFKEIKNFKDNQDNNEEDFLIDNYFKGTNKKHGAELIEKKLSILNLNEEILKSHIFLLRPNIYDLQREREKLRIRVLESFLSTNSNPSWMILSILPVIPPGLRPMIQLEGGRFATSDLNELYRKVIMRNNRLGKLFKIRAPDVVVRNEKRLLQEAVDALIDNGKRGDLVDMNNRPFKSLSDAIEGKQGRFRQNLLGKRVDYSGRSVITVEPKLKLHQCGLPYEMAIELYKPFLIYELIEQGLVGSIKAGKKVINENQELIVCLLQKIFKSHPILLNRAPTLHRLGVQAFEPILVYEKAILFHPLVCPSFNADFDGDQIAVHIPLSLKAQAEAISLLFAPSNFLSPATGLPIVVPSQDILLGCYYLTTNNLFDLKNSNHYFSSPKDALLAYENKQVNLHSLIWVRYNGYVEDNEKNPEGVVKIDKNLVLIKYKNKQIKQDKNNKILVSYLRTTIGRLIFNNFVEKSLNLSL
jgi:DNA-directed RNA polymerase subunit beta'